MIPTYNHPHHLAPHQQQILLAAARQSRMVSVVLKLSTISKLYVAPKMLQKVPFVRFSDGFFIVPCNVVQ